MGSTKLVKNLLVLILFCAEIWRINSMRTSNEEEDTPDAHIVYDQRQNGKYNIHVVIKDVAIIEMDQNEIADQNYSDQEYYYDEDDLTVKPLIIKTSTTSVKPLDSTTKSETPTLLMQTTVSAAENQSTEITSKATQEFFSPTVNISNTSDTKLNNNVAEFMTFLTTHRPAVDTKPRSKIEPIYAIEEPFLQPKYHLDDFNYDKPAQIQSKHSTLAKEDSKNFANSRIFKVKVHRSHRAPQITPQTQRCRSYQYRDSRGNCRSKRSSSGSILKRLFRMLVTLPFNQNEQQIDD